MKPSIKAVYVSDSHINVSAQGEPTDILILQAMTIQDAYNHYKKSDTVVAELYKELFLELINSGAVFEADPVKIFEVFEAILLNKATKAVPDSLQNFINEVLKEVPNNDGKV